MRNIWDCSVCVGSVLIAVLTQGAATTSHTRLESNFQTHRLEKAHEALRKRDLVCQAGWSSCAASFNGGCCPVNYACETSFCYATTAGPTTACGREGYYNCPLDSGAGACCPVGYICGTGGNKCELPVGASISQTCPTSYYLCPSSLGYGCCRTGLGCGRGACFSTNPSTFTVTVAITTTDSLGRTTTRTATNTTVVTPAPATVTIGDPGAVAKLIPSTVSKQPAIESSPAGGGGGGGLTQGQLGGIIGGIVALLVVIIIAAVVIVRRLRKTAKIVEQSNRESSGDKTSNKAGYVAPTVTEIDPIDIDPLSATPTGAPVRGRNASSSSIDFNQSPARSPQPTSGQSTPPIWPSHYNQIPNADPDANVRHPSMDSATGGYYDPVRLSQMSQFSTNRASQSMNRMSYDPQAPYASGNRWSAGNASEVTGSADGAHGLSELDAIDAVPGRRSSGGSARPPLAHVRRGSDGNHGRSESGGTVAPLGTVVEDGELHGFYGPENYAVGQTAARPPSGSY